MPAEHETMTAEEIEALKIWTPYWSETDCRKALDTIEAQAAAIARLTEERDEALRQRLESDTDAARVEGERRDAIDRAEIAEAALAVAEHAAHFALRREETSRKFWLRAAESAITGDMRELRLRVDLAKEPPVEGVLSDAALKGAHPAQGGE